MLFVEEFGKFPHNVYLGGNYYAQLKKELKDVNLIEHEKFKIEEDSIFEMKIFILNNEKHIGVGIKAMIL